MSWIRIGQMAAMNGITEETLRYYDYIGLLKPCHTDSGTGYRYYDISQSVKLDLIQYMKSLGMQLNEIKKQLDTGDISIIRELLERQSATIDLEIQTLTIQKSSIERVVESYEKLKNHPPVGIPVLEYIQKRFMFTFDAGDELYNVENGEEVYELGLRKMRTKMMQINLPYSYFCNTGIIVPENIFKQNRLGSTEVFAFVDSVYADYEGIKTIPAATFLSIYCDDFNQEMVFFRKLFNEIESNKYLITGDYICEEMAAIPAIKGNQRDMRYRIQVPVTFR